MDGWIHGWMDPWMDGSMDGWMKLTFVQCCSERHGLGSAGFFILVWLLFAQSQTLAKHSSDVINALHLHASITSSA